MQDGFENSRYRQRTKRRKTNYILNGLIGMVFLLIIIVSAVIFLGGNKEPAAGESTPVANKEEQSSTEGEETNNDNDEVSDNESTTNNDSVEDETDTTENESNDSDQEEVSGSGLGDEDAEVVEEGSDPNIVKTYINPNWQPVGTTQTGEHVNVYEGVDWDEMVQAITYATGLEEDNMTIYFLGNNGHNKSVGTVYPKDKSKFYRVYIEWVDNQGWKPTKVEELLEIPKENEEDKEDESEENDEG